MFKFCYYRVNLQVISIFAGDYLFTGINIGSGTRQSAVYRSSADPADSADSSNTLVSDLNNQMVLKGMLTFVRWVELLHLTGCR